MKTTAIMSGCTALTGLVFAWPAFAQVANTTSTRASDQPTSSPTQRQDDEITVTARRVVENIQDIPLAVTALGGAALRNQVVRDLRDLSGSAPNLIIAQGNADAGSAVVTIRGQSQTNITPAVDSAVGLYMDNINNPRSYGLRSAMVDIGRVEILRGPQGTLYGRNTTGGAVSIFTNDPGPELGGSVRASYGNYDAYGILGILNLPIATGVGLRLVASHEERDPWAEAPNAPQGANQVQFENSDYFRAKFRAAAGPLTVSLTGDYFNLRTGGFVARTTGLVGTGTLPLGLTNAPIAVSDGPALQVAGGTATLDAAREIFGLAPGPGGAIPLPTTAQLLAARDVLQNIVNNTPFYTNLSSAQQQSNNHGASLALDVAAQLTSSLTLRSISGYRSAHRFSAADNTGLPFVVSVPETTTDVEFFSQEIQLLRSGDRLDWVLGGFYSYEDDSEVAFGRNLFASTYSIGVRNSPHVISKSVAAFGQLNWRFADGFELTLGARWTQETKSAVIAPYNINVNPRSPQFGLITPAITGAAAVSFNCPPSPQICSTNLSNVYSAPSWLASLSYHFSPDVMMYGKATRGFRGGGQNNRTVGSVAGSYDDYKPETVTEFEAGLRSVFFDSRLTLNLSGFYDLYRNVQRQKLSIVNGTIVAAIQNAARARLWGLEGEANFRVSSRIRFEGSIGYLNPAYQDFTEQLLQTINGVPTIVERDRSGEDWPAPRLSARFGIRVTQPTAVGNLTGSFDVVYQSRVNLQPQAIQVADVVQPGYALVNGRVALAINHWNSDVSIFVRNLFQQRYYTSGISLESLGVNVLIAGEPRMFGLQWTTRFGSE